MKHSWVPYGTAKGRRAYECIKPTIWCSERANAAPPRRKSASQQASKPASQQDSKAREPASVLIRQRIDGRGNLAPPPLPPAIGIRPLVLQVTGVSGRPANLTPRAKTTNRCNRARSTEMGRRRPRLAKASVEATYNSSTEAWHL